eukprot:jgi/Chrpa1/663/Chrysochromulina_OHIO_Genome00012126-RA
MLDSGIIRSAPDVSTLKLYLKAFWAALFMPSAVIFCSYEGQSAVNFSFSGVSIFEALRR